MTIYRNETYADGAVVATEAWDTVLGTYTRTGTNPTSRPLTPTEVSVLAAREASELADTNLNTLTADVAKNIATLLTSVTALNTLTAVPNATINASPASYIKDAARECKTVARQTIRLARIIAKQLNTTDSGT